MSSTDHDQIADRHFSNLKVERILKSFAIPKAFIDATFWFLALRSGNWQLYVLAAVILIVSGLGILCIWLAKRGRPFLAMKLIFIALWSVVLIASILVADLGLTQGIMLGLLLVALALITMPQHEIPWLIAGNTLGALSTSLIALYGTPWQLSLPTLLPFLTIVVTIVLVIFVIHILKHFKQYNLQTKLLFAFLFVTVLPLILLTYRNVSTMRTQLTKGANEKLFAAAFQTAAELDTFLLNGLNSVRTEARIVEQTAYFKGLVDGLVDQQSTGKEVVSLLKTFRDKDPNNIVSYAVLNTKGHVLFDSLGTLRGTDESDQAYFREPLVSGQAYISPVLFSPETDEGFFYFSHPLHDTRGRSLGVLRVQYRSSILQTIILPSTGLVGGQSFAVVFDENHLHLAHGLAPETINKLTALPETERMMALQTAGRLPAGPLAELSTNLPILEQQLLNAKEQPFFEAADFVNDGNLNQVAAFRMRTQPWLVTFFQPQDVYLAPVVAQIRNSLLVVTLIIGTVVTVTIALARLLTGPIARLSNVAVQAAAGDLTVKAEVISTDEIGMLAQTFNYMTTQLQQTLAGLEQMVTERTRDLSTSAAVSRRLSMTLEPEQLVKNVVEEIQAGFDYYHTQIYLFDDVGQRLMMAGGSGEAGQALVMAGHTLTKEQGLVGRAASIREAVLVTDVSKSEDWLPNVLLPDTKAEIAIPIAIGDEVLGVLNIQHHRVNGLAESSITLLQSIADQIAIGLQNARAFEQARNKAEREAFVNSIGQKIQAAHDLESTLEIAAKELGQGLRVQRARVQFGRSNQMPNGRKVEPGE